MKKSIRLFALGLYFSIPSISAQQAQTNWELSKAESGTKSYVARDYISLKPGFSYKAVGANTFTAKIDEYLVFTPSDSTYGLPGGPWGSTPATGGVVGAIPGQFDVSPLGAATYAIPIEVPAGINGMQPNISLVYNSQAGNGIAGWGWNIGGLSMISRVTKNLYYDGVVGKIDWTKESSLALDGQRLIKISDTEYRTENESFSKITVESIQSWGPEVIKVQTKDGLIMEYGKKGSAISYSPISSTKRLGWLLSKVYDQYGNYTSYNYSYDGGETYKDIVLQSVSYGSSSSGQDTEIGRITFTYSLRTDVIENFVDGTHVRNNRILSTIETFCKGTKFRRYVLNYKTCNITKSRLQSVDCYNATGERVNPTTVQWQDTNTSIRTQSINASFDYDIVKTAKDKCWYSLDYDGDGVSELVAMFTTQDQFGVYWTAFEIYKMTNNSGNISFKNIHNVRFSGGSIDWKDVKTSVNYISSIKFFSLDRPSLAFPLFASDSQGTRVSFQIERDDSPYRNVVLKSKVGKMPPFGFGDFNNDGYDDIVVIEQAKSNDKYPLHILYGNADKSYIKQEITTLSFNGEPDKLFISDFNADGLKDLMVVTDKGYNLIYNNGGSTLESGVVKIGLTVGLSITNKMLNSSCSVIKPGDFNGDGLQDFIINKKNSSTWYFVINRGSGYYGNFSEHSLPEITAIEESFTGKNDDKDQCLVMDFNNDGKDDVIIIESDYKKKNSKWPSTSVYGEFRSSYVAWYKSTGTGVFQVKKLQTNREDYSFIQYPTIGDFDGDGQADLLNFSSNLYSSVQKSTDKFYLHYAPNRGFIDGRVTSIKDGLNNRVSFIYKPLTDKSVYSVGSDISGTSSIFRFQGPLYVASNAILSRNSSVYERYEYSYETALFHTAGKGFLGFIKTNSKETYSGIENRIVNKLNTTYNTILPYSSEKLVNGNSFGKSTNEISLIFLGSKRFVSRLSSVKEENKLSGTTVTSAYSNYDIYGNPKTITTDYGGGISQTQSIIYVKAGSWCDNKVKSFSTTKTNASGSETLSASYDYYNSGKLKTHIVNPDKGKFQITNSYEYDSFGNLTKETVNNDGDSRSITRTYTPSGRFLKTETNNQLKETVTYNFNEAAGILTSMVTPSGTTKYKYDGFGRVTQVDYPDKNRTATARQWAGRSVPGAIYYVYEETSGSGPVKVWYDGQGRELRRDFYGLGGKETHIKTEYNSKGQLYRVSEPYTGSAPARWAVTYQYDNYGRKQSETTPLGVTTFAYSGLKTTVTTPSGKTETTLNSAGQVVTAMEDGKAVTFSYYPSGRVKSATPEGGAAVTFKYDLLGNRTEINDPDAGTITTRYNGFGELQEQSREIHSGQPAVKTTYAYDAATKLLKTVSVNGQATTYTYDTRNRLKSETISGVHTRTYEYDSYSRPVKLTENVAGKSFVRSTAYDAYGRVAKETFPSGYYVTNTYDNYGHHTSVTDSKSSKIWEAKEADAFGRLTKYNQGGRTTTMAYDPETGLPSSIVASGIINMSYIYDGEGQLKSRSDGKGQMEVFTYDGMNRLGGWTLTRTGAAPQNYSMTYDPNTGGIQNKPNVSYSMNYGGKDGPPRALTSVGGMPQELKAHAPQTIEYNDFNKVTRITQEDKIYNLTYGTHRQRIKSILSAAGSTKQTKYYLGNYEEEVDAGGNIRKLHYIYGSNTLAAIMEHKSGQENLYYTYTDYQGNLMAVTDAAGTVKERYAYDPWGFRKNPTNWSVTDTRTSFLFSRGYTLHEHLDDFGLINMNGRMYDPLMAQFLSPDPYIQAPGSWMNYNRYAYCYNNPLIYSDPSGEFIMEAIVLGAIINTTIQGVTGNIQSGGDYYKAIAIGGLSGAAGGLVGQAVAGAIGMSTTLGGSVFNGCITGASGGFAGGFIGGAGNAWAIQGASFGQGLNAGFRGAVSGAISGAVIGGITSGYRFNRINNKISLYLKDADIQFNGRRIAPTQSNLEKMINNFTKDGLRDASIADLEDAFGKTIAVGEGSKPGTLSDVLISKRAFRNSFTLFNSVGHEMVHVAQHYAGLAAYTPFMEYGAYDWNRFIYNFEGISMPKNWSEAMNGYFNEAIQMNHNWTSGEIKYSPVLITSYFWHNIGFKFNFAY
jgi:RHS repeat-associated protein